MQAPKAFKAYKAEYTLGLIGAIFSINTFLFSLGGFDSGLDGLAAVNALFSLAAIILGFISTSQLNKNNKSGGTLLTVSGGLSLFALISTGVILGELSRYGDATDAMDVTLFHAIIATPLLLTGGILALARKRPAQPSGMAAPGWPSPGHYPGQGYPPPPAYTPYVNMPPYISPYAPTPTAPAYPPYAPPQNSFSAAPPYTKQPYAPATYPHNAIPGSPLSEPPYPPRAPQADPLPPASADDVKE